MVLYASGVGGWGWGSESGLGLGLGSGVLHHVDARVLERRGALGTDEQQVVPVEALDEPRGAAEP